MIHIFIKILRNFDILGTSGGCCVSPMPIFFSAQTFQGNAIDYLRFNGVTEERFQIPLCCRKKRASSLPSEALNRNDRSETSC